MILNQYKKKGSLNYPPKSWSSRLVICCVVKPLYIISYLERFYTLNKFEFFFEIWLLYDKFLAIFKNKFH